MLKGRSRKIHSYEQNTTRDNDDQETVAKTVTITEGGSEISPYEYIKKANLNERQERQSPIVPKKCKLSIKGKMRKKSKEIKDTRFPLPMPDKIENSVRTPSTVTDEKQHSGTEKEREK